MKNNNEVIFFDVENWQRIDMKAIQKEEKKRQKQAKRRQRKEWFERNLGTILAVTPIAVGAVATIAKTTTNMVKAANRKSMLDKEQELKDLYCYDRSLGHYWQLKRKLTNSDWVKINKRRSEGDALADILADMNVLK